MRATLTHRLTRSAHRLIIAQLMIIGLLGLAVPRGALAQVRSGELDDVRDRDERATQLFNAGSYTEALEQLLGAQALAPSTNRLYNIAACYERLNQIQRAISFYQRFVDADDAPANRIVVAQQRLNRLRASISLTERSVSPELVDVNDAGQDVEGPAASSHAHSTEQRASRSGSGAHQPIGEELDENPEPSRRRRSLRPTAFYVTLAVTLATGVGMAAVGGVALSRNSVFEQMPRDDPNLTRSDEEVVNAHDEGRALTIATDVLLGLTCASGLATVLLAVFTNWRGDEQARRLTFSPLLAVDGAGLSVGRRF